MIKLFPYQKEYLENMPKSHVMAADTGLGKSYMALAHYERHSYPKELLVLCPAPKVNDWIRDVQEWFEGREEPKFAVYSYEKWSRNRTVSQIRKGTGEEIWRHYLDNKTPGSFYIIADEGHRACPSALSGISGTARNLGAVARLSDGIVMLTATPLPNGWANAWNYLKIAGYVGNKTAFIKKYLILDTMRGFPRIAGYKEENQLKDIWRKIATPLNVKGNIELPEQVFVDQKFEATKEYKKVLKDRLWKDEYLDSPSKLLHALRQNTSKAKIPWLQALLEDTDKNVVIFYNYISEREDILAMLKKFKGRKVFRQDGEKHELPQKGSWEGLEGTITLAQYKSGGVGVEMQYASIMVFFSPTYSYTEYKQAMGRIHRIGQKGTTVYYKFSTRGTVETEVWRAIESKSDFSERIWAKSLAEG